MIERKRGFVFSCTSMYIKLKGSQVKKQKWKLTCNLAQLVAYWRLTNSIIVDVKAKPMSMYKVHKSI